MDTATYPKAPGWKTEHPETSRQSAERVSSKASILRERCLQEFAGSKGLTADEVADRLGESVLSVRPRISELAADGKLEDSGSRRKNASGHSAAVWRIPLTKSPSPVLKQVSLFN